MFHPKKIQSLLWLVLWFFSPPQPYSRYLQMFSVAVVVRVFRLVFLSPPVSHPVYNLYSKFFALSLFTCSRCAHTFSCSCFLRLAILAKSCSRQKFLSLRLSKSRRYSSVWIGMVRFSDHMVLTQRK